MDKNKETICVGSAVLPCPFCGGNDLVFSETKSPDGTITWRRLHHGPTNECSVTFIHNDKGRLIELWNHRVLSTT